MDRTAPAAVTDLAATSPTQNSVTLNWAAPGDDGNTGTAAQYDIRYSTNSITAANWVSATQVLGVPPPQPAGSPQSFAVTGLNASTTYYFAIETADEVPNWSGVSNIVSAKTGAGVDSSSWSALGTGVNGKVLCLALYNNKVVAGGYFSSAGGVAVNGIAAWDGSSWSPLGSGVEFRGALGQINVLTVYRDKLIAGGEFTSAGGVAANGVAAWDGSSWSPLGSGVGWSEHLRTVSALTIYNNELIAGGGFTSAGGVAAKGIATWDGSSWSPLGSATYSMVQGQGSALTVYNNELIAESYFYFSDGSAGGVIAAWDGSTWSPLGARGLVHWYGYDGQVSALTIYNNNLIVGGDFTSVNDVDASGIAAWSGFSWSPLGSGVWQRSGGFYNERGQVFALTVYNNKLIAGGYFNSAGDFAANSIGAWDGSSWSPLGSGVANNGYVGQVFGLAVYNNKLIAGGYFTSVGGVATNNIAQWGIR